MLQPQDYRVQQLALSSPAYFLRYCITECARHAAYCRKRTLQPHRAPQKQRVSSIVALQCKQMQDQRDFNPVMLKCVLRHSGRHRQQATCPQHLLASQSCQAHPACAGGSCDLVRVKHCRCTVQNACQHELHELGIQNSRQCSTEQLCDAYNCAG